jgi:uncharacterized membrane protein YczE
MLIEGIIVLIIGVVLFAIQSIIPPDARKIAYIAAVILVIIGLVLIVLGAIGYAFFSIGALSPPPLLSG